MYTRWTQHLTTPEDKKSFEKEIHSAKRVLDRLTQIIDEDLHAQDKSEMDQRSYTIPNWDYLQAHRNGVRQAHKNIKLLVDLDQQKGTINDHKSNG